MKKTLCLLAAAAAMAAILPGCAVVRYLVLGDWNAGYDLVVVSQSPSVIGTIVLRGEDESRTAADGRGFALLERGESYGLVLDEDEENCTVVLMNMDGQELGRTDIHFTGERLYLTFWEDGTITVSGEGA